MPKFNLYVPTQQEKEQWEKYARMEQRSLSQFIRLAVRERIRQMIQETRGRHNG